MNNPNTIGTGQAGETAFPDVSSLSYEQARDELVETVKILELGQMSLDESLKYWERGESLAKRCEVLLDGASQRVEQALQQSQQPKSNQPQQGNQQNEDTETGQQP